MYIDLTTKVSQQLRRQAAEKKDFLAAMGHLGTHLDTYLHCPVPLEYLQSRGVLFDVRGIGKVTPEDISPEKVREGDFVLFRTGRIEEAAYGTPAYGQEHPCLSWEVIRMLTEKKIRFIGIDAEGIRRHGEHQKADCYCEERGVYVIENLSGLSQIHEEEFRVFAMWLEDEELSGLRCRVVAEVKA
ncbi:cyclase family protein [Anaerotignum lactatifermentans]|uniref:Cyclase family protein n=1 Tax=Anaerotignum lactatifermentans TaxID=160404 RepID=A0ABS2GDX2_9FIRM|nr:cyclase family protein [Anaerotignum lactatifermentans]MBM6830323.1 cyclase family protein [Anaerotignum lactatifermentans]MBM6878848.1 cyclase family protein [Anaerotignum lactatifermentans]MBM6951884.1 cyclase family protein [Anaerotignum lactatifermentans]